MPFFAEAPQLKPIVGCMLHYAVRTHSYLKKVQHLLPENVLVGANDVIPGLAEPHRDSKQPTAGERELRVGAGRWAMEWLGGVRG